MTNLATARQFFASKISEDVLGIIAGQIVSNIDRVLSDDTKTLETERQAAQAQLYANLGRYEKAKGSAA